MNQAPEQQRRVLIAGCGYVGRKTAELFVHAGWEVTALTRNIRRGDAETPGLQMLACDISDRRVVSANADALRADVIVDCVSAGRGGGPAEYRSVYLEGARNLLELLRPGRFIFTSSTSVYAQTDGSWVTEESPADPDRETGRILRETEQLVLEHGGIVARLAGIYGPDRSALLRKFLDGTAILEDGGGRFINQIHRDDAASALLFLAAESAASGIYNVAGSTPLTQRDHYALLAEHFSKPLPPAGPIDSNRKRGWTHKRVSNARLRALGWQPHFSSSCTWQ